MSNLDERLNAIISQGSDTQQMEDEYTMVPTVTEVPITEYEIVPSKLYFSVKHFNAYVSGSEK